MYIYYIFCIHSSVEGYLGSFQLLAIINSAAMNIVEHVHLLHVGESSGYMPRSGIAGSFGSDMPSFLRDCQTDFQSGCILTTVGKQREMSTADYNSHSHSSFCAGTESRCNHAYQRWVFAQLNLSGNPSETNSRGCHLGF